MSFSKNLLYVFLYLLFEQRLKFSVKAVFLAKFNRQIVSIIAFPNQNCLIVTVPNFYCECE